MSGYRPLYTLQEDKQIVQFILHDCNASGHVRSIKGDQFWKDMENDEIVPRRTWQSLKNRWTKYISLDLRRPEYGLSQDETALLIAELGLGSGTVKWHRTASQKKRDQKLPDLPLPEKKPGLTRSENTTGLPLSENTLDLSLPEKTPGLSRPEKTPGLSLPKKTPGLSLPEKTPGLPLPEKTQDLSLPEKTPDLSPRQRPRINEEPEELSRGDKEFYSLDMSWSDSDTE